MLDTIQSILTAVATGAGIYFAFDGLHAWKREMTGKRDIELCQKVIEMFYEAEHKMNVLRSPMSYTQEGEGRAKEEGETEEETRRRNHLFVPIARFNTQSEFWSEFFSYRFRMRALFGDPASDAFRPADEAIRSFRAAATTNYQAQFMDERGLNPETRRSFENQIWAGTSDPDVIADKMREAITAMEAICVPIVRATKPSEWLNQMHKRLRLF
ncbi:hypothetical protein OHD62_04880 [Mesorhizobium sp. YC-39]|uniref:hypothetical protein n=1 Tax=unclassified Mesorhizobium TaxID=325217 RepID=UPI0021E83985|nr:MULTISPECIES: hypothetical protein [unclassified Mesorhizobium]MCV3205900.1 hypothetical protein [Mesorhizobium sp. YC-2]MCV3227701.1 hypothetical protein [Mesorhizobium sp. YC-39]